MTLRRDYCWCSTKMKLQAEFRETVRIHSSYLHVIDFNMVLFQHLNVAFDNI